MENKILAALVSSAVLFGCISGSNSTDTDPTVSQVKFGAFNVSFAVDGDSTENYKRWVKFMSISSEAQDEFIAKWRSGLITKEENKIAERIIQIRNIAAIIQKNRPDVLFLTEFNNDGKGKDMQALKRFQENFLSVPQSLNSADGGDLLEPISYPFMQNFATNTGLDSNMDLSNSNSNGFNPNDAYGWGFYHGQYAFALMSKYKIDTDNIRTFQKFNRKDLPTAQIPVINKCDGSNKIPEGMKCKDNWFTDTEWNKLRLSSKNHIDAPIIIPTADGGTVIHVLGSHPTPPGFDTVTDNNKLRNKDEVQFWNYYINGGDFIYDDNGKNGGFEGKSFVIMGDLNSDTEYGPGSDKLFNGIQILMSNERVNQEVSRIGGSFVPTSNGAAEYLNPPTPYYSVHPYPKTRTGTFNSRADYAIPSADLAVIDTGVYWQAEGEEGRLLFNDARVGKRGTDKEISSDHRFVWVTIKLND